MGRGRKPLALQKGNLTKKHKIEKEQEESLVKGDADSIRCPSFVKDKRAKKEFKRLLIELKELEIISVLDVNNLAQYCIAFANYVQATEELNGQALTIQKCMPNGSYTYIENPLIKIQKLYAEEMRKFAGLVGLTVDSRLKIATTKAEKQDSKIIDEFGDI